MNKNAKKIFCLALLLLAITLVSTTYSYWAGIIGKPPTQNQNINITSGISNSVATTINLTNNSEVMDGKKLVPLNKVVISADPNNSVDKIHLDYDVYWVNTSNQVAESDQVQGTLNITKGIVLVDNQTGFDSFFNIENNLENANIILNGPKVTVRITITMSDLDSAQYESISNSEVSLEVIFNVEVN